MAGKAPKIYWDACCFLAILNNEPEAAKCISILEEARDGAIALWVSPLTMAETVRPKGSARPLPAEHREKVLAFFDNEYIRFVQIDREIARQSLEICWDYHLQARDAIHLAAAHAAGCEFIETKDEGFIGRVKAYPGIAVRKPRGKDGQEVLDYRGED